MARALFGPQSRGGAEGARPGLPLLWRLVLLNLGVVFGGTLLAAALAAPLGVARAPLVYAGVAILAAVLAAWLTLRLLRDTLLPLRSLRDAVQRFDDGDHAARAAVPAGGDPDVALLAAEMNLLWDRLERDAATIRATTAQAERLALQVLSAQEDERRRVARELHDEAGQALTALIIGLERGLASMPESYAHDLPVQPRKLIGDLRDLAVRTLDEVRNLALELRPSVLDDLGLVEALRQYLRSLEARTALSTRLTVSGLDGGEARLPAPVETAVFRIVQEAATNTVRHAGASSLQVLLRRARDVVALEIRDDGAGIALVERAAGDRHLGLFGMAERARLLGGECRVAPVSPRGTLVQVEIPLSRTAE